MARIASLLGDLARACASVDFPKTAAEADTSAFEIATLRRAFGPSLPMVLKLCGMRQLAGRADLDALVGVFSQMGL